MSEITLCQVFRWALSHDGPESITGDLPSGLKRELEKRGVDFPQLEADFCPWYDGEIRHNSSLAVSFVAIADALEAAAWLQLYGSAGTESLVADLKQETYDRAKRYDGLHSYQGKLIEAVWRVAEEVWSNKFAIISGRKAFSGNEEGGQAN